VQVFINDVSVLRYAHDNSYFKAVFDSKWETKPDLWAVLGHIPDDMRVQLDGTSRQKVDVQVVSGHIPDDMITDLSAMSC
jgi:hypothetical protein